MDLGDFNIFLLIFELLSILIIKVKNSFLLILITFFALLSCNSKQQPWDSDTLADPNNPKRKKIEQNSQTHKEEEEEEKLENNQFQEKKIAFTDKVKPLFEKHCMLCHSANPKINWLEYETALNYVNNGKLYLKVWELKDDLAQGMPLGNVFSMTEEERQQIVDWIEEEELQQITELADSN